MRNYIIAIAVVGLWLVLTPILCFICWQAGGSLGPLFLKRPSTDVKATLTPVSLSDDLTNTPLVNYSFSMTVVPKSEGLPASGYLLLSAVPRPNVLPTVPLPDGRFDLTGIFELGQESWKPIEITQQMVDAHKPFIIFLDCQKRWPNLVEFRMPRLCREK